MSSPSSEHGSHDSVVFGFTDQNLDVIARNLVDQLKHLHDRQTVLDAKMDVLLQRLAERNGPHGNGDAHA